MPTTKLAGPLGSGVTQGSPKATTWAALSLEQQREQRMAALQEVAIERGERELATEQATTQAMAQLQELPGQVDQAHNYTQIGATLPKSELYARGAQGVLKDFQGKADPESFHRLTQEALEVEMRLARRESRDAIKAGLQEHMQANPQAAQTLAPVLPFLDDESVDPDRLLTVIKELGLQAGRAQLKAQEQAAEIQNLDAAIADMATPQSQIRVTAQAMGLNEYEAKEMAKGMAEKLIAKRASLALPEAESLPSNTIAKEREGQMASFAQGLRGLQGRSVGKPQAAAPARVAEEPVAQPEPAAAPKAKPAAKADPGVIRQLADAMEKAQAGSISKAELSQLVESLGFDPSDRELASRVREELEGRRKEKRKRRSEDRTLAPSSSESPTSRATAEDMEFTRGTREYLRSRGK